MPFKNSTPFFPLFFFFLSSNYYAVDTASAIAIALMTFGTMYPMSVYSGKVLLQVRQCCKRILGGISVLLNVLICFKDINGKCSKRNV